MLIHYNYNTCSFKVYVFKETYELNSIWQVVQLWQDVWESLQTGGIPGKTYWVNPNVQLGVEMENLEVDSVEAEKKTDSGA